MNRRLFAPAVILWLASGATLAAAPPPTVDSVIDGYVAARGGLEKLRAMETLRQTGRATAAAGQVARVTRSQKRPGKSRFEFTVQGVTAVYVSDGAQGWQVTPFEGEMGPKALPEDALREALEQSDIEGPLVDWKRKGHQVELLGRETVNGREAYKLKLTLKGGAVRYAFIDVRSYYEVRSETTRQIRGQAVRVESNFSGHKKTQGILFPRAIEVGAVGRPQRLHLVVEKIEVNPPLSDALFQISDPAK